MALRPRAAIQALPAPARTNGAAPGERLVKLNTLESPLPASPAVIAAIRDIEPEVLRTPTGGGPRAFQNAIAEHHGLDPDRVLAGRPVHLLAGAINAFLDPGSTIATPRPMESLLPSLAAVHGHRLQTAEWLEDFALPVAQLLALKPGMILLANPNSPTGTAIPPAQVGELADAFEGLLVIDESWAAFADEDCLALLGEHSNLLILRSLAASHGLAGLDLAYLLGHAQLIEPIARMGTVAVPDVLSQAAGAAALADQDHAARIRQHVREERGRLILELQLMGFTVPPSQANFVLTRHPDFPDAAALHEGLLRLGILVHYWSEPGLSDAIRVTVGTSQQNNALLAALGQLNAAGRKPAAGS